MFNKPLFYLPYLLSVCTASVFGQDIGPYSVDKIALLCADMAHPYECGRAIEKELLREDRRSLIKREGKKLSLTLLDKKSKTYTDKGDEEEGEATHFSAYYAECDCYLLYTTAQKDRDNKDLDKTGFILLVRENGSEAVLPNEPKFDNRGKRFFTLDHCPQDCEQKLAVWEWHKDHYVRSLELALQTRWTEVEASWKEGGRIELIESDARDKQKRLLTQGDKAWKRLR